MLRIRRHRRQPLVAAKLPPYALERRLTIEVSSASMAPMGLVHTTITLRNARQPELQPVQTRALADTGAL